MKTTTKKPKLNPNARKWVRALRSGKYKQARNTLERVTKDGPRYCCLGLACALYAKEHEIKREVVKGFAKYDNSQEILPQTVQDWLGLNDNIGEYGDESLAEKNDKGCSFKAIADIIELQPEGLFAQ